MAGFAWQDGQTIVMVGDSITDCGRRAAQAPYGAGYVQQTIDLVTARYPERRLTFFNRGIGGNTVEDLRVRWHDDVLSLQPDWATILVGINDLHRTLSEAPTAVPPDRYAELYREVLELTKKNGTTGLVLLDPFYISTDTETGGHRSRVLSLLPEYIAVVESLAKEFDAVHIPTHALFQKQLQYRPAETFCPEPVHPNPHGHLVITHALLTALGW